MSHTEMGQEEKGIRWDRIGYILMLVGFMISCFVLVKQVKKQHQQIVKLQLDLVESNQKHEAVETDLVYEIEELKGIVAHGDENFNELLRLLGDKRVHNQPSVKQ